MNKYIIGLRIETDEQISFNTLPGLIKDFVNNGKATIVSAEWIDECIKCGGTLPPLDGTEENDFRSVCEDCEQEEDEEAGD